MNEPVLNTGNRDPEIYFKITASPMLQHQFTFYSRNREIAGTLDLDRVPAFEGSLDESAHAFFEGVSHLWNNEVAALRAKLQAAEAEVARLTKQHQAMSTEDTRLLGVIDSLQAEVARPENLVDSAYMRGCAVSEKAWRKDATVAALRWAWDHPGYRAKYRIAADYIDSGIDALLDGRGE